MQQINKIYFKINDCQQKNSGTKTFIQNKLNMQLALNNILADEYDYSKSKF